MHGLISAHVFALFLRLHHNLPLLRRSRDWPLLRQLWRLTGGGYVRVLRRHLDPGSQVLPPLRYRGWNPGIDT
jgi:hypothetical protein